MNEAAAAKHSLGTAGYNKKRRFEEDKLQNYQLEEVDPNEDDPYVEDPDKFEPELDDDEDEGKWIEKSVSVGSLAENEIEYQEKWRWLFSSDDIVECSG